MQGWNIPLFAFVIKNILSSSYTPTRLFFGGKAVPLRNPSPSTVWRCEDMLMGFSSLTKILCQKITKYSVLVIQFTVKIFSAPSPADSTRRSCLHLNFPKRFKITFQYRTPRVFCMLCSVENIEKYDGNLWTLIWLHLAAFPSNKHLPISTSILWQQQRKNEHEETFRSWYFHAREFTSSVKTRRVFLLQGNVASARKLQASRRNVFTVFPRKKLAKEFRWMKIYFQWKVVCWAGGFHKSSY